MGLRPRVRFARAWSSAKKANMNTYNIISSTKVVVCSRAKQGQQNAQRCANCTFKVFAVVIQWLLLFLLLLLLLFFFLLRIRPYLLYLFAVFFDVAASHYTILFICLFIYKTIGMLTKASLNF